MLYGLNRVVLILRAKLPDPLFRYGVPAAILVALLGLTYLWRGVFGSSNLIFGGALYVAYIMLFLASAWSGYGPGLAILLLTIVLPRLLGTASRTAGNDAERYLLGAVISVLVSRLGQFSRQRETELNQRAEELEIRVRERTEEALQSMETLRRSAENANAVLERNVRERTDALEIANQRLEYAVAEADAANRAKSTFLSTMSHEIRTPMNAILGYAQLMLRDPELGADAKANLRIIGRSGEHLLALINDVLDMSRIEAGHIEVKSSTFNLPALLHDLAAMFRLRAEAKALRFEMLTYGEESPYVQADEGKIRQSLINILGNAIKFTRRGQIWLHVTQEQRSGQLWLSARVEDTGPGISEEDQENLFEPFSQAKGALNTQEGTGLGLAITRKFARLMGGDVTVASVRGQGSTFRFEVPIERGDAAVALRRSAPHRVTGIRGGTQSPRILVVDDQFENRDWLAKLLSAIGFPVLCADSGEAALRSWREWKPRLILMDVHMPGMNGLDATRRIKAHAGGNETLIVTLTASAMEDDRQSAALSGADDFLPKPCREDQLLGKIGALLNIQYDYEEPADADERALPAGAAALSSESLAKLPPEVVEELRLATRNGDKNQLDELILTIRDTDDAGQADTLQNLADNYEYDTMTRLLEEACQR